MENKMNDLIFEDIYEPIKFQMKNKQGEIFDCETIFRSTEDNIKLEEISKYEYDEEGKLKGSGYNKRTLEMAVIYCGMTEDFWKQFSSNAISKMITTLSNKEKEKYKKKQDLK
jgi:hypothetical protein